METREEDRGRVAARAWLKYLLVTSEEPWRQTWELEQLYRTEGETFAG